MTVCKDCRFLSYCKGKYKVTSEDKACDDYDVALSLEDATKNVQEKFVFLERMITMVAKGICNGIVIRGPGGTSKTFTVTTKLQEMEVPFKYFSGYTSNVGLFNNLYLHKDQLIVFDDVDAVWRDLHGVNILKAVLDTKAKRGVSWNSPSSEILEPEFEFEGRIIFITNAAPKDNPHYKALLSRIINVDLELNHDEMLAKISTILAAKYGKTKKADRETIFQKFTEIVKPEHGIDIRLFYRALDMYQFSPSDWESMFRFILESRIEA